MRFFFQLRTSLPWVYSPALSVLSEEIILLVRLREPALELCRLSNIDDYGKASPETPLSASAHCQYILVVGERRATMLRTHIIIRAYNPFRVQRSLKLFGGAKEVTLESGNVAKVVKEPSVYRGGELFCNDIETGLSYVETIAPYGWCNEILLDMDIFVVVHLEVSLSWSGQND